MRKIAENHAANLRRSDQLADSWADDLCLAKIGDDLRHCYADVTGAKQPPELVELAQTVDALKDTSSDEAA